MFAFKVCIVLVFGVAVAKPNDLKCKNNEIKVLAGPYIEEPRCVPDNCDRCKLIQCTPPLCQGTDILLRYDRNSPPNCHCCPGCGDPKNPCADIKCIEAKNMECPPGKTVQQPDPSKNKCCPSCG